LIKSAEIAATEFYSSEDVEIVKALIKMDPDLFIKTIKALYEVKIYRSTNLDHRKVENKDSIEYTFISSFLPIAERINTLSILKEERDEARSEISYWKYKYEKLRDKASKYIVIDEL